MYRIVWSLVVFLLLLATLPPGLYLFSNRKLSFQAFGNTLVRYKWHILVIFGIYGLKSIADRVNDSLRDSLQLDFTSVVYAIEGDTVLHIQNALLNDNLTIFLAAVYTLGFLFVANFSFILSSYDDDRHTANKMVFVNLVLTCMSLIFFLFIPVFVTSWPAMDHSLDPGAPESSGIPGMRPLLYQLRPWLTDFFSAHDTFDNCIPSLHIAIPLSMTLILLRVHRTTRKEERAERESHPGWRESGRCHTAYLIFIGSFTCLIALSTIYLGIHWLIDIPAGIALVPPALWLADRYDERFFARLNKKLDNFWDQFKSNKCGCTLKLK
jgi:Ca2+/Na+ antiporter